MPIDEKVENRILIIDDEEWNVEPLMHFFNECHIPYDYASSLAEAVELLVEAHTNNKPYFLVICDNHFCQTDFVDYVDNFDGIDLANIITGNNRLSRGHKRFIKDYFGESYQEITSIYRGRVIMFSGSAGIECQNNPDIFEGIAVVQKAPDSEGNCCEQELVSLISGVYGLIFTKDDSVITGYKRNIWTDCASADGIHNDKHEQAVRKFLTENGIDSSQFDCADNRICLLEEVAGFSEAE